MLNSSLIAVQGFASINTHFRNHSEVEKFCQMNQLRVFRPAAAQRLPVVMSGRHVLCIGIIGVPRVLSYVLPALLRVNARPWPRPGEGATVLVLRPTRESAQRWFKMFSQNTGIRVG